MECSALAECEERLRQKLMLISFSITIPSPSAMIYSASAPTPQRAAARGSLADHLFRPPTDTYISKWPFSLCKLGRVLEQAVGADPQQQALGESIYCIFIMVYGCTFARDIFLFVRKYKWLTDNTLTLCLSACVCLILQHISGECVSIIMLSHFTFPSSFFIIIIYHYYYCCLVRDPLIHLGQWLGSYHLCVCYFPKTDLWLICIICIYN